MHSHSFGNVKEVCIEYSKENTHAHGLSVEHIVNAIMEAAVARDSPGHLPHTTTLSKRTAPSARQGDARGHGPAAPRLEAPPREEKGSIRLQWQPNDGHATLKHSNLFEFIVYIADTRARAMNGANLTNMDANPWKSFEDLLINSDTSEGDGGMMMVVIIVLVLVLCCCSCSMLTEAGLVMYLRYFGKEDGSIYKFLFVPSSDDSESS
jgi:hypothetical protein